DIRHRQKKPSCLAARRRRTSPEGGEDRSAGGKLVTTRCRPAADQRAAFSHPIVAILLRLVTSEVLPEAAPFRTQDQIRVCGLYVPRPAVDLRGEFLGSPHD